MWVKIYGMSHDTNYMISADKSFWNQNVMRLPVKYSHSSEKQESTA